MYLLFEQIFPDVQAYLAIKQYHLSSLITHELKVFVRPIRIIKSNFTLYPNEQ